MVLQCSFRSQHFKMYFLCEGVTWIGVEIVLKEQHALKSVNSCLNTNIYSYLETSGGQSSNLDLNVVHFFNTSVN